MIQWSGPIPMISVVCNEAWKLSRWQRMRINLAGFAMDAFLCGIAGIVGLMFDFLTPWVWIFLLIHMIRMMFALCPFLPGDGYWALVDGFGQPNLWGIALDHLKNKKASMFSLYAAGRIVFIGLIWLLYGYVLHL